MELEDALAAPSTAQSSSESTAIFGRKSSGSGDNDGTNVPTPINEFLDRRPLALPATSSGTERGRQDRKDRSNRSSSFEASSTSVIAKTIIKFPVAGRSADGKSKSPRSNCRSSKSPQLVKGSVRDSGSGRSHGQDPEAILDRLLAAASAGLITDPMLTLDGKLRRVDPNADNSCGKRDSSQNRGRHG